MISNYIPMGEELDVCNTSLGLGIGDGFVGRRESDDQTKNKNKRVLCLDLSFPLYLKEKEEGVEENIDDLVREYVNSKEDGSVSSKTIEEEDEKMREQSDGDNTNNNNNNNNNNNGSRKKLRLTKEQSTLLEDSFKLHTTLNTGQKQALAEKLNLLPRQVEVWFQNRRARTKLKQTEVDCEFLKKCCESLRDENRRLKKELQELCSLKMEQPQTSSSPYIQFPKSTILCPSCEKIVKAATGGGVGGGGDAKNGFPVTDMVINDHKFYKINNSERRELS